MIIIVLIIITNPNSIDLTLTLKLTLKLIRNGEPPGLRPHAMRAVTTRLESPMLNHATSMPKPQL